MKIHTRQKTQVVFLLIGLTISNLTVAGDIKVTPIDAEAIRQEKINFISAPIKGIRFSDIDGEQLLLLTKRSTPSKSKPNKRRIERHELKAVNLIKSSRGWVQKWAINDFVDCPELDSEANFFLEKVSVTDVNNDGYAEISVPYSLFCGGGIDSKNIKIIMRTKNEKFAIRGESKVFMPHQEPFGGVMKMDAALQQHKYAAYKDYLTNLWNDIYIEKY